MVESVRRWLARANSKQKQYLANLFTIAGGTIMFSVWQFVYSAEFIGASWFSITVNLLLSISSGYMLKFGYDCLATSYDAISDISSFH
jgi:hypothetical protein